MINGENQKEHLDRFKTSYSSISKHLIVDFHQNIEKGLLFIFKITKLVFLSFIYKLF